MKIGTEVEGRFKGLRTLFMTADELKKLSYLGGHGWGARGAQQVYISDLENRIDLNDDVLRDMAETLLVTVERTDLKECAPTYVHIILRIPMDFRFALIRQTDQIKIEPTERKVFMVTKEQMIQTVPEDYREDKTI